MNEVTVAVAAAILLPVGGLMIKLFQIAMTWQAQSNAEKERTIARKDDEIAQIRKEKDEAIAKRDARIDYLEARLDSAEGRTTT